ncbi:MAG TPA: Gfo/Idh/MocA family oxidoreductase [Candidatus Lokiarchaeia archaeon]|nr:Gfo/Idh/MocA family oxidoreductase [Candidatus Lokiarchaeia archaeon]
MSRKIGVGFVGTGNIAFLHTLGYKDCPDAEIVALCDLSKKRAASFREETGLPANVKIYKDIGELCRDDQVGMVEILTPHASHEALAVQAAEAGKHVSVQKPPAMTLSSYDRMVNAARKAGVRFRVYENFRYHPPYARAFELIRDGVIGQVAAVNVRMYMSVKSPGEYRGQKLRFPLRTLLWKNKDSQNYKAPTLFDDGYHKHSIVQGFLGDVPGNTEAVTAVRVWCGWQRLLKAVKIDSPAVVVYETKKPDRYGTWNVNTVSNLPLHSNYFACDESLEITGSDGLIMAPGCTGNLFVGCDCGGPGKPGVYWFSKGKGEEPPFPDSGTWKADCSMPTDWSQSFIDCTRHYASVLAQDDWFDDKDPRPIRAEQGRQILQINLGVIRSLRTDGARARLADILDGPGIAESDEPDGEEEVDDLDQSTTNEPDFEEQDE